MATDCIGKGLAVTGRTMKIDDDHRVALSDIRLRVPTKAPTIMKAMLGPTVNEKHNRDFALWGRRSDHEAIDTIIIPTAE